MTPNSPARMVVVKREDKEPKLRKLLSEGLAALEALRSTGDTARAELRVVALSAESPVVRAVLSLAAELGRACVDVRLVLAKSEHVAHPQVGRTTAYRHLSDPRCHDAHESLALGTQTAWVGDCMRRDPVARDSFELHAVANADQARMIIQSFERLWRAAVPFAPLEDRAAIEMAGDLAALGGDTASAPQVLTRH